MQTTDGLSEPMILIPVFEEQRELPSCLTSVAGLPLIRRVMLMAGKAGFANRMVLSAIDNARLGEVLEGTGAQITTCTELNFQTCNGPILLLAPDCLPQREFFTRLADKRLRPHESLLWDDRQAILLCADCSSALPHYLREASCFAQLRDAFDKAGKHIPSQKSVHEQTGITIGDGEDCRRAETTLLSGLVKATEGWMALHINRKISLAVTRRLMRTSVTPNDMTWVSMALGLIGAACFLSPAHSMQILGALFFLAHSILDGCDGELARLKFMESRLGGILDFWSDNIVHVSIFAAMGVGWAAASPDAFWPLLCAGLAVGGTAVSASLVYIHTMHAEKKAGPLYTSVSTSEQKSAVVRIADILSRRDFIYLVLLLALLNHTHWFLIMTAIGAPIYALLLIGIMLRD